MVLRYITHGAFHRKQKQKGVQPERTVIGGRTEIGESKGR